MSKELVNLLYWSFCKTRGVDLGKQEVLAMVQTPPRSANKEPEAIPLSKTTLATEPGAFCGAALAFTRSSGCQSSG